MLIDKIREVYRKTLYSRVDDNGSIFYFSSDDFEGLNKEEYIFDSSRGHKLKGYFYYYKVVKFNSLVIFDHGMGGGHRSYMKEIEMLARKGYLVLAYDHSGCMESEGESTFGFPQSLMDLDDCIKSIKAHPKYESYDISVIGHSWGAYSCLNIPSFHEVKHIIAMAGFISVKQVISQFFAGPLVFFRKRIYQEAVAESKEYALVNAVDSLKKTKASVLVIHSKDDKTVKYNKTFKVMKDNLEGYINIKFMTVEEKNHNPNYTKEAVEYKDKFFKEYKEAIKKGLLNTEAQKETFKRKYDWNKMTAQDEKVWKEIFKYLENN